MTNRIDQTVLAIRHLFVLAVAMAVVAVPHVAEAQQHYESLKLVKGQLINGAEVRRILKGGAPLEGNEKKVDDFFTQYVFAMMAPDKPQDLEGIGQARIHFGSQYLGERKLSSDAARRHLNQLTMKTMKQLVEGNYRRAVRNNAVLVIGMLNARPAHLSGGNSQPPEPLPEAGEYLIGLLDERPGDAALKDALLNSTIIALERHVRFGLSDPQQRAKVTAKMLELVSQKEVPQGRSPEVHAWLRSRAADLLATQGEAGSGNEIVSAVRGLFVEEGASDMQRRSAALALGGFKYEPSTTDVATQVVYDLGEYAVSTCLENTKKGLREMPEFGGLGRPGVRSLRGRSRGFAGEEDGMMSPRRPSERARGARNNRRGGFEEGNTETEKVPVDTVFPRRELANALHCAQAGISAAKAAAKPDQKALADTLDKQIDVALKTLGDPYMEDLDVVKKIDEAQRKMADALSAAPVTPAEKSGKEAPSGQPEKLDDKLFGTG